MSPFWLLWAACCILSILGWYLNYVLARKFNPHDDSTLTLTTILWMMFFTLTPIVNWFATIGAIGYFLSEFASKIVVVNGKPR